MGFRSHVARPFDPRAPSNVALFVIGVTTAVIAVFLALTGTGGEILWAPVQVFAYWALLRELDPDNWWSAVAAAIFVAVWALTGQPILSIAAPVGLMVGSRVIVRSTGRRPLTTDLLGVAAIGIGVGYTTEGWVSGVALAVGMAVDDQFDAKPRRSMLALALIAGAGTTIVAVIFDAIPGTRGFVPRHVPTLPVVIGGLICLALILRRAAPPTSLVDARHKSPLDPLRLHIARAITAVASFVIILAANDRFGSWPLIACLGLALVSNEIAIARRR